MENKTYKEWVMLYLDGRLKEKELELFHALTEKDEELKKELDLQLEIFIRKKNEGVETEPLEEKTAFRINLLKLLVIIDILFGIGLIIWVIYLVI